MSAEVILTRPQAQLCQAVLCQELMKICGLLGKDVDGSGNPLDDEGRYSLTRYSLEVQTTLLAFGMSSEALERIVKDFSR